MNVSPRRRPGAFALLFAFLFDFQARIAMLRYSGMIDHFDVDLGLPPRLIPLALILLGRGDGVRAVAGRAACQSQLGRQPPSRSNRKRLCSRARRKAAV